jgi:hypothetical protein
VQAIPSEKLTATVFHLLAVAKTTKSRRAALGLVEFLGALAEIHAEVAAEGELS